MQFSDKNILIIGASSGIGLATAQLLHGLGAQLFTASRHLSPELEALQTTHISYDATQAVGTAFDQLPDVLHGVIYCPGSIKLRPFERIPVEDFQADFDLNVLGAVRVVQATIKRLKKAGGASVVLFSTVAADTGMSFHTSIATAKAAVEGLTRALAAEYAASAVRVNCMHCALAHQHAPGRRPAQLPRKGRGGSQAPPLAAHRPARGFGLYGLVSAVGPQLVRDRPGAGRGRRHGEVEVSFGRHPPRQPHP